MDCITKIKKEKESTMNMKMLKMAIAGLVLSVSSFVNAGLITLVGDAANDVDTAAPTLVNIISTSAGTITDLNLFIDFDASCCAYDNTLILKHIDTGTSAIIWVDSDSSGYQTFGEVRNTTFDDEASIAFINAPFNFGGFDILPGEYRSSDLLSIFDGESLLGSWQLSIQNTGCCVAEGDDLLAWSIIANVDNVSVPEPSTVAIFSLGIMGLASRRFKKQ
jgi:hypothetical protein